MEGEVDGGVDGVMEGEVEGDSGEAHVVPRVSDFLCLLVRMMRCK